MAEAFQTTDARAGTTCSDADNRSGSLPGGGPGRPGRAGAGAHPVRGVASGAGFSSNCGAPSAAQASGSRQRAWTFTARSCWRAGWSRRRLCSVSAWAGVQGPTLTAHGEMIQRSRRPAMRGRKLVRPPWPRRWPRSARSAAATPPFPWSRTKRRPRALAGPALGEKRKNQVLDPSRAL